MHTLYQANLKNNTTFLNEWFAVDLVRNQDGVVVGVIAIEIETGEVVLLNQKQQFWPQVVQAVFTHQQRTHTSIPVTGSEWRYGLDIAMQDMEMWQFHPTGITGAGACDRRVRRGEGGYLINKDGERFMERYAPNAKDLAGRDVVARSMATEILEGRGCGENGDHVYLKLDHLG